MCGRISTSSSGVLDWAQSVHSTPSYREASAWWKYLRYLFGWTRADSLKGTSASAKIPINPCISFAWWPKHPAPACISPGEQEQRVLKRAKASVLVGASGDGHMQRCSRLASPETPAFTGSQLTWWDLTLPAQQSNCDEWIYDIELAGCSKNLICEREHH